MTEEQFNSLNIISLEMQSKPSTVLRAKGHTCGVCQKWFKKSSDLRRHGSVHSNEKPFPCDHCSRRFASKDRLNHHRKYLNLEKSYECEICHKMFKSSSALKVHLVTHSKEKLFTCEMCHKGFGRKNALFYHYASQTYLNHHRQFEYFKQYEYLVQKYKPVAKGEHVCALCNKQFKRAHLLQNHAVSHSNETPYKCDVCGRKFKSKKYIPRHKMEMHSTEKKRYFCMICKKSYCSKSSLSSHRIVHQQEKPFKCEICPRAFKRKNLLVRHISCCHTGEKKYACVMCDKRYKYLCVLRNHIRGHTDERPFVCQICNTSFKSTDSLKRHCKSCKKKDTSLETKKNFDSKVGSVVPKNENIDSKIVVDLPKKIVCQPVSKDVKAPQEVFSQGSLNNVFVTKNIKFVKVQNTAELNLLRITRLFQRYRCLSNLYSK